MIAGREVRDERGDRPRPRRVDRDDARAVILPVMLMRRLVRTEAASLPLRVIWPAGRFLPGNLPTGVNDVN